MIELTHDMLNFTAHEAHNEAEFDMSFIRTFRIPDDGREYPLPPGFSRFPLHHVDDFASRLPEEWQRRGGIFLPMYQTEALWISFQPRGWMEYPFAIKIAAGKINALTGDPWTDELGAKGKQDYLVFPRQPWLDGFYAGRGLIRQFVAMPLGEGYTVEEQLTGKAEYGGLQIVAYPIKKEHYEREAESVLEAPLCLSPTSPDMGLAPGGLMRQEIADDEYGLDAWNQTVSSRCYVHIVNSLQYVTITGKKPPSEPPTAEDYNRAGLPWFDYYDKELTALDQATKLGEAKSVGDIYSKPKTVTVITPDKGNVREWDPDA